MPIKLIRSPIARHVLYLAVLVVTSAAVAQVFPGMPAARYIQPGQPTEPAPLSSNQKRASCVVKLLSDSPYTGYQQMNSTIDSPTLAAVLTSTAVEDPAAQKALSLDPDQWPQVVQIDALPVEQGIAGTLKISVTVTFAAGNKLPPRAADMFLDELVKRAQAAVEQVSSIQQKNIAQRRDALQAKIDALRTQLEPLSAKISAAQASQRANYNYPRYNQPFPQDKNFLIEQIAGAQARLAVLESAMNENQTTNQTPTTAPAGAAAPAGPSQPWQPGTNVGTPNFAAGWAPRSQWPMEIINLKATIAENQAKLSAAYEQTKPDASATEPVPQETVNQLLEQQNELQQQLRGITNQLDQLNNSAPETRQPDRLIVLDGSTNTPD
jgi:prefoldin subunit 5